MKQSAGVLLHRRSTDDVEVLLGHPGGPFWVRKDDGAWSIPKGEYEFDEDPWDAAKREFAEELGCPVPAGQRIALEAVKAAGKILTVFAVNADFDTTQAKSNTFTLEWPKGSGRFQEFPELDRVAWLSVGQARRKLVKSQVVFLDRLLVALLHAD